jgi:hypothetical protein
MTTTQTKYCSGCRTDLPTFNFSKCSGRDDGLQFKCKSCNKIDNHKFRTQINPKHHSLWQKNNSDRVREIVNKWRQADKAGTIYYIKSPDGAYYIGMTKCYLNVRWSEHLSHWRLANTTNRRKRLPLLHDSFDKWGPETHEMGIVAQFEGISREELKQYERVFIKSFKELATSLNTIN